ncbi:MAG: hypothetical protein KIS92_04450 [Planctomycetota bacterium]|nr:hypothetical protein [Planctomycetota bacterium]
METKRDPLLRLTEEGNLEFLPLAKEGEKPEQRSFRMKAYSGAPVRRIFGVMAIDLAGISFAASTPILKNHDPDQIVGMSEQVVKTDTGLMIEGRLSRKTKAAQEVSDLADENFKWQASVGLEIQSVERVDSGAEVIVNGRKLAGPAYVVRKSKLRESSFVPVGADDDTSGEVLSLFTEQKGTVMSVNNDEAKAKQDAEAAKQEGVKAERQRGADLKAAFPKDQAFALEAIEKGWTVQEAKAAYADKLEATLTEKDKEIETLKKTPAGNGQASGTKPVNFGVGSNGAGEGGDGKGKSFLDLAGEIRDSQKVSVEASLTMAAEKYPEKHREYVDGARQSTPRKIERVASK